MAWAVWLAVPVGLTLLAAMWTWVRSRPPRQPSTARAMREHSEYLDALAAAPLAAARGVARSPRVARSRPDDVGRVGSGD